VVGWCHELIAAVTVVRQAGRKVVVPSSAAFTSGVLVMSGVLLDRCVDGGVARNISKYAMVLRRRAGSCGLMSMDSDGDSNDSFDSDSSGVQQLLEVS